jgi:thiol-disulfide isomerase/thioredoxin
VRARHDDRDEVVGGGTIDLVHDQALLVSEARIAVDVGLTRRLGASVVVPVRAVVSSIRYLDAQGGEVELVRPGVHHRDETVSGLGDPMVLGVAATSIGGVRLAARAGATVPVGRTEDDPFRLGAMGLPHQHLQMGTGTINPVVAAEASRRIGPWTVGGFALTQQVVYAGRDGYQAGDRYAAGATVRRRLARWTVRGGGELQAETAERWGGVAHTDDGNRGRLDVWAVVGAEWSATASLGLDVSVKIPVVTRVVGGQLEMPAVVEVGASWAFGKRGRPPTADDDDHDHDHDHGEDDHDHDSDAHADAGGLDVVDLGPPGAAVEIVPVVGKVTVFDYWAVWCKPCKELEGALIAIARAHPGRIAIRRIDVVDWDTPVTERDLDPGGFSLPHVKVFDAAGRLVLEMSSDKVGLEALITAVRDLVARE